MSKVAITRHTDEIALFEGGESLLGLLARHRASRVVCSSFGMALAVQVLL
jgi:hypothetical protein